MRSDNNILSYILLCFFLGVGILMQVCKDADNWQRDTTPSSVSNTRYQDTNNNTIQLRTYNKGLVKGEYIQIKGLDTIDYSAIEEAYLEQMEIDPEEYEDYDEFEYDYLNN